MRYLSLPTRGRGRHARQRRVFAIAIAALVAVGGTMIGVSVSAQESPPSPPAGGAAIAPPSSSPKAAVPTPSTSAPSTSAPSTSAPSTSAPSTSAPSTSAPSTEPSLPDSKPVSIRIPSINVASSLITVGLNSDGSMQVPHGDNYQKAAWYRHSPTAGELGPSIIIGHVDSHSGPAVFFRLGDLRPKDKIKVKRADGKTATFVVRKVKQYPKAKFPTHAVYHRLDYAGLRLITCGGAFDSDTGHYESNIVAYAALAGTHGI